MFQWIKQKVTNQQQRVNKYIYIFYKPFTSCILAGGVLLFQTPENEVKTAVALSPRLFRVGRLSFEPLHNAAVRRRVSDQRPNEGGRVLEDMPDDATGGQVLNVESRVIPALRLEDRVMWLCSEKLDREGRYIRMMLYFLFNSAKVLNPLISLWCKNTILFLSNCLNKMKETGTNV